MSESKHPPNPLPCGCRAKAWPELYVVHCPLHTHATELLEALERITREVAIGSRGEGTLLSIANWARAAIRKTTEGA